MSSTNLGSILLLTLQAALMVLVNYYVAAFFHLSLNGRGPFFIHGVVGRPVSLSQSKTRPSKAKKKLFSNNLVVHKYISLLTYLKHFFFNNKLLKKCFRKFYTKH